MNFYEHHLGDYIRDTSHLTMLEDGAYRRLLDAYYCREKPLPADLGQCCRLVRAVTKPEREAVANVLSEFFTLTGEGYRNKRCDTEIARVAEKKRKAKESANVRWRMSAATSDADADAMQSHGDGTPNASADAMRAVCSPIPSPQSPDICSNGADAPAHKSGKARRPAKSRLPDDFVLTDELAEYVRRKLPDADPDGLFEAFVGHARAKGWMYVDWGQAFQTYARNSAPSSGHWAAGQYPRRAGGIQWQ